MSEYFDEGDLEETLEEAIMSEPAHGLSYAELKAQIAQYQALLEEILQHWQASDILRLRAKRLRIEGVGMDQIYRSLREERDELEISNRYHAEDSLKYLHRAEEAEARCDALAAQNRELVDAFQILCNRGMSLARAKETLAKFSPAR